MIRMKLSRTIMTTSKMILIAVGTNTEAVSVLHELNGNSWTPLFKQSCSFPPEIFRSVMLNLIRNPNINSNHLFRADISLKLFLESGFPREYNAVPHIIHFRGFVLDTIMVRTMIPRKPKLDKPMDQSCLLYENTDEEGVRSSLVVYISHIETSGETPYYHPAVRGIGFLHTFNPKTQDGEVSIHYSFFDSEPRSPKLEKTAEHLLAVLHKHGKGTAAGYVKRVQHDVIIPQVQVQNTYARLKAKYGRGLCENWAETTDPTKHVFEDLAIAAFLIELWEDIYKDKTFPGFVDIGCGNGLLVHILIEEGYSGWGFDARRRKSWENWSPKAQENIKEMVLIPSMLQTVSNTEEGVEELQEQKIGSRKEEQPQVEEQQVQEQKPRQQQTQIHNGIFPPSTFIISNHADELTPWTPILANLSHSNFMMIPCCSHALSGARFRPAPSKVAGSSKSQFASLVAWVSNIAKDCGWVVETEMLRIPSTRNTAVIGRTRQVLFEEVDVEDIVASYGGAAGWEENAMKLVKGTTHGH
jgi:tRNASer (uridine44-2'-O)-methyltransferase